MRAASLVAFAHPHLRGMHALALDFLLEVAPTVLLLDFGVFGRAQAGVPRRRVAVELRAQVVVHPRFALFEVAHRRQLDGLQPRRERFCGRGGFRGR